MLSRLKFELDELANEIVDQLPKSLFKSKTTTFLDPSMGGGQFVRAIESKLREFGHSDSNISKRVFGFECNLYYVKFVVNKYKLAGNYSVVKYESFLEADLGMKFDVIVGNPPFQEMSKDGKRKDQASNLWSKFWGKSFEIIAEGGKICLITPTSWLSPSMDFQGKNAVLGKNRLWDIFDQYTSVADVTNVAKHFPGIGSTFGLVHVDTSGTGGLSFVDGADTSLGFLPKDNLEEALKQFSNDDNLGKRFKTDQNNSSGIRVSIPLSRKILKDSIEILEGEGKPSGHDDDRMYLYFHVPSISEANHVKQRLTDCLQLMNKDCRWSGFLNINVVKMIKYSV